MDGHAPRNQPIPSSRLAARRAQIGLAGIAALAVIATLASDARAQGWWPWATQEAPRPREPVYRGPPPAPFPGQPPGAPGAGSPFAARPGGQGASLCLQLEQRLVAETQRSASPREALPRIEQDFRVTERALAQAQLKIERGECYEYFLFTKSLRNTPQCRSAAAEVDTLKRKLSDLDAQRQQIVGSSDQRYRDDIIRELARNGCGQQYVQEARRLDNQPGGFWTTEEDSGPRGGGNQFGTLPFSTFRTVCVRLCDGYYFPVSFSTLPNHFQRDAEICQSRCAAPVELYYHQNPGAGMEQAVSVKGQSNYTQLKTAFKYRKEFVQGCSCKEAEYLPVGEKKAEAPAAAPAQSAAAPQRTPRQP
jgi:hypothetical protein